MALTLLASGLAAHLCACPSASFEHGGPATRTAPGAIAAPDPLRAQALRPPRLAITPEDAGARWFVDATVVSHEPASRGHTLALRTSEGERVTVRYDLRGDAQIPAVVDQAVRFRYYPPEAGYADDSGAFILTTATGAALAVIVRRDRLPPGILPGETTVTASDDVARLAYSEVVAGDAMCRTRVDHYDLRVATEQRVYFVPPGTRARVTIDGAPFDVVAFDASQRATASCGERDPSHTSYALLRAVSPAVEPE